MKPRGSGLGSWSVRFSDAGDDDTTRSVDVWKRLTAEVTDSQVTLSERAERLER